MCACHALPCRAIAMQVMTCHLIPSQGSLRVDAFIEGIHSFIHPSIHPLIPFTPFIPFFHSCTHSSIRSFIPLIPFIPFIPLTHSFIPSSIHSFIHPLVKTLNHSCIRSFMHARRYACIQYVIPFHFVQLHFMSCRATPFQ